MTLYFEFGYKNNHYKYNNKLPSNRSFQSSLSYNKKKTIPIDFMIYNFALLGSPVAHSLSPLIHSTFLRNAELKGSYICVECDEKQLIEKVFHLREIGFCGLNLTIPNKEAALQFGDILSPEVELMGAANTVSFLPDKRIKLDNTDWMGFKGSLEKFPIKSNKALILGAGGSARGIALALSKMGFKEIKILRRKSTSSINGASQICEMVRSSFGILAEAIDWDEILDHERDWDLIVNTTPIGMHGSDETISPLCSRYVQSLKNRECLFYDLIYNPTETQFMKIASEKGFKAANGYEMLYLQAAHAFSLWTGLPLEKFAQIS
jgi:shikimate dehydrogenase